MDERKTLLSRIITTDFILAETALFLDTHPNSPDALAFYQKHLDMRKAAAEEYAKKFGMLTHGDFVGRSSWQWVEGPWPWEYEEG